MDKNIRDLVAGKHIALIPDGNRRWALSKNLERWKGYEEGAKTAERFLEWCMDYGIHTVSVYALSNENLKNRPAEEVSNVYRILAELFKRFAEDKKVHENEVQLRVLGNIANLPAEVKAAADYAMERTKHYKKHRLNVLLQYGGRFEILEAARKIAKDAVDKKIEPDDLTEKTFESYLFMNGGDPDIVIRTAEKRISNFVLWQIAYSELFFIEKYWPDFKKEDLDKILAEFTERVRRFGK